MDQNATTTRRHHLAGRIAARLYAAHIGVPFNSEEAHSGWLCLSQEVRDYWERLASEVADNVLTDYTWADDIERQTARARVARELLLRDEK